MTSTLITLHHHTLLILSFILPQESFDWRWIDSVLICQPCNFDLLKQAQGFVGTIYTTEPNYRFYCMSREEVQDANHESLFPFIPIENLEFVNLRQIVQLEPGLEIQACASGYSLGSSCWTLQYEHYKISILSQCSSISGHVQPLDTSRLQDSQFIIHSSPSGGENGLKAIATLKAHLGLAYEKQMHVLLPIELAGTGLDLLTWVCQLYQNKNKIHYVSRMGRKSLKYIDICSEWMTRERQAFVHSGKPPTDYSEWITKGHLILHENIQTLFLHPSPRIIFCSVFMIPELLLTIEGRVQILWTDPSIQLPTTLIEQVKEQETIQFQHIPVDISLKSSQLQAELQTEKLYTSGKQVQESLVLEYRKGFLQYDKKVNAQLSLSDMHISSRHVS